MTWTGKMYDGEGKEIVMKPGHMMVIGEEAFLQIPMPVYEVPMGMECEYGSSQQAYFITSEPLKPGEPSD